MTLAGSFLVARPVLTDPNFNRTVVLLLEQGDSGAMGLVVNRPVTNVPEGFPVPLFHGGPCPGPGLFLLHGEPDWREAADSEGAASEGVVASGIFLGDAACLERACKQPEGAPVRFRVFAGYAGWGSGQLEQEIEAGAWVVVPASAEMLFDVPVDELWTRLCPRGIPEPSVN